MSRPLLPVAALSLLLAAAPAAAKPGVDRSGTDRPAGSPSSVTTLSFWGVVDPGPVDGLGLGLRVGIPVVPQGILHAKVRDELVLEVGADYLHYADRVGFAPYYVDYSWNGFLLVGGVAWNFWFTPQLALYPKVDLGFQLGWYSGWNGAFGYSHSDLDGIFLQGALGVIYRLPSRLELRAEIGSGLLRLGVGIPF
jgi:hypothetical protein